MNAGVAAPPMTEKALRHEAVRSASRELTEFLGLDLRHARYPGRDVDRTIFGAAALSNSCELVDHFGPLGLDPQGHGADPVLRKNVRVYRHSLWRPRYDALNAAFLAHEEGRTLPAPLSGGEASILGSVPVGAYQVTLCLDGDDPALFVGIGHMPLIYYDFRRHLLIVLTAFGVNMRAALLAALDHILSRPVLWRDWIRRARDGGLRRAYVIGDNRPGHFIKQSLAYLDLHEAELVAFGERGGILATVTDWCAMNPLEVFPALASAPRLVLSSEGMTDRLLEEGCDAHRVYRYTLHKGPEWLRRRFEAIVPAAPAAPGETGRFRVMISVDAERERILNQDEAFRFVLRRLARACAEAGRVLDVVWDGWTVSGEPSARDREVMGRIEAAIGRITDDPGIVLGRQTRLFGLSAQAKAPVAATCDLAFVTQGTAAIVPCWLLRRPTVVYHVAEIAKDRSCLDEETAFCVDQRAVLEAPEDAARSKHGRRFSLALWGLERAMLAALAGRLPLHASEPVPAP